MHDAVHKITKEHLFYLIETARAVRRDANEVKRTAALVRREAAEVRRIAAVLKGEAVKVRLVHTTVASNY